nr:MAG TPA: hypothetical protein [Caudoviricetes sp.]
MRAFFLRSLRFDVATNKFKKVLILSQMLPSIFPLFFPLTAFIS